MENHYKDGTWRFPEFAQPEDIFLEIIEQIDSPLFGVQYDPSNAVVGGFDPVAFLEKVKHRVVTMHASDRYLAPGATLDDLRTGDGATGYAAALKHGETGQGMNDYDAIFRILAEAGFDGWISIEDGMNGLDEIARSAEFLKRKRARVLRRARCLGVHTTRRSDVALDSGRPPASCSCGSRADARSRTRPPAASSPSRRWC